jgi:squalene-hopene/tetraprenyl-beta-curcumene cyclase
MLNHLEARLARASRHLLSHLSASDAGSGQCFRSPTRGRALETALTLHLLQREGLERAFQQRLRSWLEAHLHEADPFSRVLGSKVLGRAADTSAQAAVDAMLHQVEYARGRKEQLLQVLLAEVGLLSADALPLDVEAPLPSSHHRFAQIYAASARLMRARHRGSSVQALPESGWLRNLQHVNGGWEAQGLTTLVALLGLGQAFPECFERGLRYLERTQRDDGSIPFCDITIFDTALAGLALLEAPCHRVPDDVITYLMARQAPNGGFAFHEDVVQTDVDTTAQTLQLLMQCDPRRCQTTVEQAQQHLLALQRPDGGWPTYVRDGDAEVTMTANAVLSLSLGLSRAPHLRGPIRRGLGFLVSRQRDDGTFERSWSRCETYSIFRVVWACEVARTAGALDPRTAKKVQRMSERALAYLHAHQREDGSFGQAAGLGGDVLSTAYALSCLSLTGQREGVDEAVRFLLSRQTEEGAFPSEPDMAGPRPFVYDDPLLGTLFCVMALGMVVQRRRAARSAA